jgi:hypothetical protein
MAVNRLASELQGPAAKAVDPSYISGYLKPNPIPYTYLSHQFFEIVQKTDQSHSRLLQLDYRLLTLSGSVRLLSLLVSLSPSTRNPLADTATLPKKNCFTQRYRSPDGKWVTIGSSKAC